MTSVTRTASTALAAATLLLASAGVAAANEPGLVDGWFDPSATVVIAAQDVGAAPASTCSGYESGLPDGCWTGDGTVVAAGVSTAPGTGLVPRNVR